MIKQLQSRLRTIARIDGTHSICGRPNLSFRKPKASTIVQYTTYPPLNGSQQITPPAEAESSSKKPRSRNVRRLMWASLGMLVGITAGQFTTLMISPPYMPAPGSPTDLLLITDTRSRASRLSVVQELSASPDFKSWDAYNGLEGLGKEKHFSSGVLGGARGIGAYQRIFWNQASGEVVSVFWIGGSVSGWPGVAHGGLLASLLDEALARCAMLPRKAGVVTANLDINYRAPTNTNSFYVIRTWPVGGGSTDRKAYIAGQLEDTNGKVCVEANGLFIVPKNLKLGSMIDLEKF